jgi:hypothetical protein
MIAAGDHRGPDVRPHAGARLCAMGRRLVPTGRWRVRDALWLVLGLVLCWPVVSSLAASGHRRVDGEHRGRIVAVAAQHLKLADLDVKAATVALRAGVLTGSATVGNVGTRRAASSTAGVVWKSVVSGRAVQIGRFRVSALVSGGQYRAHFRVAVPKDASGSYVVSVCADVLGQLRELSKKNNCRKAGTVTVGKPGSGVKGYGPTGPEPPPSSPPPGGSTPPTGPGPTPATSPPDTTIDSGPAGIIGMSSATFVFHGSDTNDTFQCSLDGAPWAACTSPQQYTSVTDRAHTFQVRAVNTAGEADPTPAEATWTVDTTPPAVTLTAPTDGSMTNNNVPTFSGTAGTNNGDSPTITVNVYAGFSAAGMPVQTLAATEHSGSWSVPANAPLEDGTYTAQAIQHDEVGNVGESSADSFTIDTKPPGPVTALRIVPAGDGLHIEWTNPSDADYAGAMIRRSEGDTPPSSPASGTLITTAPPSTTTIADTTVTPGHTYSYAVFAYDYVPNYAVAATATQTMPACTDSWTGDAGSLDWGTAGNWSKNHTPAAGDVACIFGGEHEPSVTYVSGTSGVSQFVATRPVTISGGELDLSAKTLVSEATNLTLSGGIVGGQGQLILHGQTEWTAGVVVGEGDTTIPARAVLSLNDGGCCNAVVGENHSLTVGGELDVAGSSQLRFLEGAKLSNSGTIDFQGDGSFITEHWPATTASVVNSGTLEETGGSQSLIYPLFDSSGRVSAETGQLLFYSPNSGGASDTGSYTTSGSNSSIAFAGGRTLGAGVSLTGTVEWFGGEVTGTIPAGSVLSLNDGGCCNAVVGENHSLTVGGTLGAINNSWLSLEKQATLTFGAGSVFKAGEGVSLNIPAGATLNSEGTHEHPVVFTAVTDDTVGSHINHKAVVKPSAGEWRGIEIAGSGATPLNTNLGYVEMRYASTALALRGEGNVAVRGIFINNLKAVEACNWGTAGCSVDAAYTYWGSSEGPFPSGSSPLTCGAVTTSPYRTSASSEATSNAKSAFAANCDSSPTPEERVASAQASASAHISSEEIRCGEGFKEACEVIELYKKCLGSATQLAAEQSPFTFSNGAQSVGSDGASWLEKSESVVVSSIGHVASFGFQILGVANTILSIANAYNTCG